MNIAEVRKLVSQLQSNLFKNSNSYSLGMLKSHFRGSGLQFKEHRVYESGDDVRFIDWKMMAKTTMPYVKTFDEERNVEILVVIDAQECMFYGHKSVSKLKAAIDICCLLFLLADQTDDYIHAIVVADETHTLPKSSGEKGIVLLVSLLRKLGIMNENGEMRSQIAKFGETNFKQREAFIQKHLSKGREVVLLSDFDNFLRPEFLRRMLALKNVHSFRILSPIDDNTELPFNLYSTRLSEEKGSYYSVNSKNTNKQKLKGKRIKNLRVDKRYLEDFVKEML